MPVSPYMLWSNTKPTKADDDSWVKWYTTVHLPDIVSHGAATRGTFYRETLDFPGSSREHHDRQWLSVDQKGQEPYPYLAIYQTDFEEFLKTKEFSGVSVETDMFPFRKAAEAAALEVRNYELLTDYDPDHVGESTIGSPYNGFPPQKQHADQTYLFAIVAPKYICTVEVEPADDDDYNAWYEKEHLDALHNIPVYRRSQRYKLGPVTVPRGQAPRYVAIHELDDVKEFFQGPGFDAAWSEWTKRIVADAKLFVVRAWEKVEAVGFEKS